MQGKPTCEGGTKGELIVPGNSQRRSFQVSSQSIFLAIQELLLIENLTCRIIPAKLRRSDEIQGERLIVTEIHIAQVSNALPIIQGGIPNDRLVSIFVFSTEIDPRIYYIP